MAPLLCLINNQQRWFITAASSYVRVRWWLALVPTHSIYVLNSGCLRWRFPCRFARYKSVYTCHIKKKNVPWPKPTRVEQSTNFVPSPMLFDPSIFRECSMTLPAFVPSPSSSWEGGMKGSDGGNVVSIKVSFTVAISRHTPHKPRHENHMGRTGKSTILLVSLMLVWLFLLWLSNCLHCRELCGATVVLLCF